ncbi:MAG TPA: hypothetical protein VIZ60_06550 [Rubrobacter sp.]
MTADGLPFLGAVPLHHETGLALLDDVGRGVRGDDAAVSQYRDTVAKNRLVHQVGADEQRRPTLGELPEGLPKPAPELRVHRGRRLVQEDYLRIVDEGAR